MLLEKGLMYETFSFPKELTALCDLTNWMTNEVTFFPKCHTLLSIMLYCVDLSHAKGMVEKKRVRGLIFDYILHDKSSDIYMIACNHLG